MRLFHRLADIVSANLHELIERYEDPELLLKQAVREMDESVQAVLAQAVKVVAHEKTLARQLATAEAEVALWQQKAATAVRRGDEPAARAALLQKRLCEAAAQALARHLAEASAAGQSLRQQIDLLRLQTDAARRKLVLLAARQRAAAARQQLRRDFSVVPLGERAVGKFERMADKVEQMEAEADAWTQFAEFGCTASALVSPAALGDHEIEAELAALEAHVDG